MSVAEGLVALWLWTETGVDTTQFFILSSNMMGRRCTGSHIGSGKSNIKRTVIDNETFIHVLFNPYPANVENKVSS